ncbi:alpha/beta hydrolase [Marinomonas sp. RSW2]|uniref:Alpha/beta hydrolase n=1 Tax=Marinomonas maritima TaxID=2940935 RepID=A0ABT5WDR2_9GAMM|nr:alpha/beta hydrolase [Marinomonas maritima]MDE8602205.1 alpha/beta hydrolase [Marinomonas maritima]
MSAIILLKGTKMSRFFVFIFGVLIFNPFSYAEEIFFENGQDRLSGHYLENTNGQPAKAVLLFVHGDGAMSYDADGYYGIIWERLRENGYAIFSWDKPGVGDSSGNWLEQRMTERQSEVLAAIDLVQDEYHFSAKNTGLVGFSQAGWILPALANKPSKVGFIIGIGFATNWVEQGSYLTKIRHQIAGSNKNEITSALDAYMKDISFFQKNPSYSEYLTYAGEYAMEKDRYNFVLNNFNADARHDYSQIKVPSLFLWGEKDLNVNAKQEFEWWQSQSNKLVTTKLIENANHGMLNSNSFDSQNMGFWQWIKLMWLEEGAFSPDFLPTVLAWLEQRNI